MASSDDMSAEERLKAQDDVRKERNREAAKFATEVGGGLKGVGKIAMIFVIGSAVAVVALALWTATTTGG